MQLSCLPYFSVTSSLAAFATGTPAFLAPECCQIGEFHTKQADIWAAGVSMYYMLFGAVPFNDDSETTCVAGQMRSIVEKPLVFPPHSTISPEALLLLTALLEKDPERRISLDSALLSPWIAYSPVRPVGLKHLPSGLPDNEILPVSSAEELRRAVITVNNWVLLVKVKTMALRHVQGFRDRHLSAATRDAVGAEDDAADSSLVASAGVVRTASSNTTP